ncbi:uncharacterized protein LOC122257449 [Penaeus japonicus]|uniref:uncharacterized protein LOC122257449 n=1 Tax=Penaeus japonicus TaxID=27405 RepID=UPI001C71131F|nr:uncharacterized protein LOC122257449 [Penaeus japonicus]
MSIVNGHTGAQAAPASKDCPTAAHGKGRGEETKNSIEEIKGQFKNMMIDRRRSSSSLEKDGERVRECRGENKLSCVGGIFLVVVVVVRFRLLLDWVLGRCGV